MSRENVELAEAAYAAFNRDDLDGFLALVHPEVEFRSLVAEADDHIYRGYAGVREWWASVRGAFEGMRFDVEEIRSEGDVGISRLRVVAQIGDGEVSQTMWQAWRARDGVAIWWASFRTGQEALEAVGLTE
jgi:ketosteroid isomerase-like protein